MTLVLTSGPSSYIQSADCGLIAQSFCINARKIVAVALGLPSLRAGMEGLVEIDIALPKLSSHSGPHVGPPPLAIHRLFRVRIK